MENLKIKVRTPQESKEAQELFFELGASWCFGKRINENLPHGRDFVIHNFGTQLFWAHLYETENFNDAKEITIQQLRDKVVLKRNDRSDRNIIDPEYDANLYLDSKGDLFVFNYPSQKWKESNLNGDEEVMSRLSPIEKPMKEYLEKQTDGTYKLVMLGDACKADDIEVPDGADKYVHFEEYENYNFYKGDYDAVWQDGGYWDHDMDDYKNYCKEFGIVLWQREPELPFNTDLEDAVEKDAEAFLNKPVGRCISSKIDDVSSIEDENNHYFINVSDLDRIDFYEIARRYKVTDPCVQHILKKCLAVGDRGYKDFKTDIKDIYKTARRATIIHGVSIDK